tara:strand:+ start:268750 stop:271227 length:2478 start_codon:yes stop_codon:yes gene_type:complete
MVDDKNKSKPIDDDKDLDTVETSQNDTDAQAPQETEAPAEGVSETNTPKSDLDDDFMDLDDMTFDEDDMAAKPPRDAGMKNDALDDLDTVEDTPIPETQTPDMAADATDSTPEGDLDDFLDESLTVAPEATEAPAPKASDDMDVDDFSFEETDLPVTDLPMTDLPSSNDDMMMGADDIAALPGEEDAFDALSLDDDLIDAGIEETDDGVTMVPGVDDDELDFGDAESRAAERYSQGEDQSRPAHERFYQRVLNVLRLSEDLNVDSLAVARIKELQEEDRMPQLAVRDLVSERLIDNQQLARAVARSQGRLEILNVQDLPEGARSLRKELDSRVQNILRERRVIPLRKRIKEDNTHEMHLAYDSPMRDLVLEATLADMLPGYTFIWHFAAKDVCGQFWVSGDEGSDLDEGMEAEALLDRIVTTAVDSKASDIHIDPNMKGENKATIKYRVDGHVRPREVVSLDQLERLRVRIENIARMPKVNQNHPNKGAFSRAGFDWRVQIQPHSGRSGPVPRIVIRRLNPDSLSMERLGYPPEFIEKIQAAAKASNGVIFWTGPTGSGKTESIHSAVISVDPMGRGLSVHTIEDPPEKRVDGYAVQMEVAEGDDARSGIELLKSSLRADPDVVIFGEVRDRIMAKLVFEAANTGHLVFSTLHTNTSVDAIIRLDELDIRGFLISYVRGIAAQRLVRRLCTHCRQPMDQADDWTKFCFDYYDIPMDGAKLYRASKDGCPNCGFTGYRGRIAVAEWLVPNKEMVKATAERDFTRLEEIARDAGWQPMGHMGVMHMKNGITDAEELGRVILELSVEVRQKEAENKPKISGSAGDVRI